MKFTNLHWNRHVGIPELCPVQVSGCFCASPRQRQTFPLNLGRATEAPMDYSYLCHLKQWGKSKQPRLPRNGARIRHKYWTLMPPPASTQLSLGTPVLALLQLQNTSFFLTLHMPSQISAQPVQTHPFLEPTVSWRGVLADLKDCTLVV